MPRPERPLDTGDKPLTLFARELRKLRESAGSPPYRRLARDAHYSATTLSDAAGGKTPPSLAVTLAYVRACGGDPAEWEHRWHETHALLGPRDPAGDTDSAERRPPYLGLSAFRTADADRFFGHSARSKHSLTGYDITAWSPSSARPDPGNPPCCTPDWPAPTLARP